MRCTRRIATTLILFCSCGGEDGSTPDPGMLLVTPAGQALGAAVEQVIGPAGGSVTSGDGGLVVLVPPGAIDAPTTISIQPITNEVPGGGDLAYRLGPDGQTFLAPVTLTFHYTAEELAGGDPAALEVAYQQATGGWVVVPVVSRDEAAGTLSVETPHFTDFSWLEQLSIVPEDEDVAYGGSVFLTVVHCGEEEGCTGDACSIHCWALPGESLVWAIDGVEEVGGMIETASGSMEVHPEAGSASYTAPASEPANNPVTISAECPTDCIVHGKAIVLARIRVGQPPYDGSVDSTDVQVSGVITTTSVVHATLRLVFDEATQIYQPDQGLVDAQLDIVDSVTPCSTQVTYNGPLTAGDGGVIMTGGDMYLPFGSKQATFSGTTTCNATGTPEPITLAPGLLWWPVPSGAMYQVKPPDDRLEESVSESGGGRTLDVSWLFVPEP